jgi:NAD+ diphosphatase
MSWVTPRVVDVARADQTDPSTGPFLQDLTFAGPGFDRDADARTDPDLLPKLLADSATRVLPLRAGRFPVADAYADALALRSPRADDVDAPLAVYLGRARPGEDAAGADTAYVGVIEEAREGESGDGWAPLRPIAAGLAPEQAALAATLGALANWHATHVRCPRCGAPTTPVNAGWVRRCEADGSDHFPRTDPAVIVAVTDDDDRLLLARGVGYTSTGMSVLAGFLEPGETLAGAVAREVAEEVGLVVDRIEYLGDQPWPFPTGLMVGFRAHAVTTKLCLQDGEIEAARWWTKEEFAAALASGELHIAGRLSIARRLIEDWWGGPIDVPETSLRR